METPNLTLELCGGLNVGSVNEPKERYRSLEECADKRHLSAKVLSEAKRSEPVPHHGFQSNGQIQWESCQPFLLEHWKPRFEEVALGEITEKEKWQLEKLKEEVIKLRNHNRTKSKDFISRKLVLTNVNTLYGNLFSQLSRYLLDEMPAKCNGMNAVQLKEKNSEFINRLFSQLKYQSEAWERAEDIQEDENETEE
jgi:hypothetical protein